MIRDHRAYMGFHGDERRDSAAVWKLDELKVGIRRH
jgi:hypothetical protein